MAEFDLSDLYDKYEGFTDPIARVYMGGNDPEKDKKIRLEVTDYNIEISSDFKASIATFSRVAVLLSACNNEITQRFFDSQLPTSDRPQGLLLPVVLR